MTDPPADRDLLDRFLSHREEAAFAELVRRHAPGVWGACRRRLDSLHDAEDAFQAAFVVLVRRASRLRPGTPLGPWLGKVAALTARNVARGNRRRAAVSGPLEHDIAAATAAEPVVDVDAALRALPDADRAAVTLCHLDGLTRKEAAKRLGCPEGTLSARLSRAIGKLRVRLADEVPPGLVRSTVRVAVVAGVASGSAGASPAVAQLAEEAIRMLWVKKLTAAGLVLAAAGMVGLGVARTADAGGDDTAAKPAAKADKPADRAVEGRWFDNAWQQNRAVLDEVRALQAQRDAIQRRLDEIVQARGPEKADRPAAAKPDPPAGGAGRHPGADEIMEMNRKHLAALAARRRELLDEARSLSEREARLQRVLNEIELRFPDDRLKKDLPADKPDPPAAAKLDPPAERKDPRPAETAADVQRQFDNAEAEVKAAQARMAEALNRRDFLQGRLASALQRAGGPAWEGARADLRLAVTRADNTAGGHRFGLEERTAGGLVSYHTAQVAGVAKLLARAKADPNGPKTVAVEAEQSCKPEHIRAALVALKEAGFKTAQYHGPAVEGTIRVPGPGRITPGNRPDGLGTFTGPIDLTSLERDPPASKGR